MRNLIGATFLAVGLAAGAGAFAADTPDVEATLDDIRQTFGVVPSFAKNFPEAGLPAAWAEMKAVRLSPDTALSGKEKELIGLAVAAQIPCDYCVHFHTEAAKLHGATEAEIKEAIAIAAITRHWSTVLNGAQLDREDFRKEAAAILDHVRAKQTAAAPKQDKPD